MRNVAILIMLLGLFLFSFPEQIGGLVIGSFAFVIAIPSFVIAVYSVLAKNYLLAILGGIFLLTAFRIMAEPSLLLSYIGIALILSSVVQLIMVRKYQVLLSACTTGALGILAVLNAQASLKITAILLGIMTFGIGFLIFTFRISLKQTYGFTFRPSSSKKIDISVGDCEEADFEDLE